MTPLRLVRGLREPARRAVTGVGVLDSGSGLANATMQQRLALRLFHDFLVEEGVRESNPVTGVVTRRAAASAAPRGRWCADVQVTLDPGEAEWLPIRNRLMLALAYDSALRREELCALRTDDLDPRTARSGCGLRRPRPAGGGW